MYFRALLYICIQANFVYFSIKMYENLLMSSAPPPTTTPTTLLPSTTPQGAMNDTMTSDNGDGTSYMGLTSIQIIS